MIALSNYFKNEKINKNIYLSKIDFLHIDFFLFKFI